MYQHKFRNLFLVFLLLMFVTSLVLAGTTGKLRGKVTDKQTGEPLIGASVVIDGSSMGASTDVNGQYIILNVPPGTFKLRSTYLGFQTVRMSNVSISVDQTTEINFELPSEAVAMKAVEVVVDRPLVNKSATNTVATFKSDQIENLPVRGVAGIVALSAGVVNQGGNLYVRGGRSGEVAYYVDGVLVNNPMNRSNGLNLITNSVEEVAAQIGGMTAEYGNALSGVVSTSTKIGSAKYNISTEVITDGFLSGTKKYLGTYSYGLNEYVLTVSGPVIPGDNKIRFFVAGQRLFNRSAVSTLDGVKFPITFDSTQISGADYKVTNRDSGLVTGLTPGSTPLRGQLANMLNSIDMPGGRNFGGLSNDSWGINGNVYFDFTKFNIKMGGTFNTATNYTALGKSLNVLQFAANSFRPGRTITEDMSGYLRFTHILDEATYYTVNANYFSLYQESGDIYLWRKVEEYGKPGNKYNGYLVGPSREPSAFTYADFSLNMPGFMNQKNYTKISRINLSGRVDFVHQFGKEWELKVGAEGTRYTLRTYTLPAFSLARARFNEPTASDWRIYNSVNVDFMGYNIYGTEFDGGSFTDKKGFTVNLPNEGPAHPLILGGYIQNKIELPDLIVNAGLRFDYLDPGSKAYKNPLRIGLQSYDGIPLIADSSLINQEITAQISPRLGFSFPVTDRTVFHAEYGKFIALAALNDIYDSRMTAGRFLQGGYARQYPNPNLKPERTTDYQIGFRQQVGDVAAFDLSFFYKDTKDLIVIRQIYPEPGAPHNAYISNVNGDFGTVRGLTLRLDLRRTERVAINANYTLQSAMATGSTSGNHFDIAWQDVSGPEGQPYFPVIPSPTDFDRSHFGNVSLDYRFAENDGPTMLDSKILERAGANFLFTFSSGRRYTKQQVDGAFTFSGINAPTPYENLNSSTAPWTFQLDLRVDKTVRLMDMLDLNVYIWVVNVLNTKNTIDVYPATGLPNTDGWFTTEGGQAWSRDNGADAQSLYDYMVDNNNFYSMPRVIRLGAKLTF